MLLPPCLSFTIEGDPQLALERAQASYARQFGRAAAKVYVPEPPPALVTTAEVIPTSRTPRGYLYLPVPAAQPSLGI